MSPSVSRGEAAAVAAWRFIAAQRRADGGGWHREAGRGHSRPDHSFYHGSAGIILFLLELAAATVERAYLDEAAAAGEAMADSLGAIEWLPVNESSGWAGLLFVFSCLYRATGDVRFADAARTCCQRIVAQAGPRGAGLGWVEPIPFADITGISGEREVVDLTVGAGGAVLALLHAHRAGLAGKALACAVAAGDRLIELGEPTGDGVRWSMMADMPFPFPAPNFSHGSAGIAFVMAELARATGEARFLDMAVAGAQYALSRRSACGGSDGSLICHVEGVEPPLFYLGLCHGPPGTGRTLVLLHELTGEARWLDAAIDLMRGLMASGAPERRSEGLWQNYGQCCGDAGIGDFALLLARRGLWDEGAALAQRCADHILDRAVATPDGGLAWDQAEHRARPELVQRQTGYMQGAAGIGSFLLHFGTWAEGRAVGLHPLDWPRRDRESATDPMAAA